MSMQATLGESLGLPVDASTEGWRIDHLLHFTNYAALVLTAIVVVWLVVILFRDRRDVNTANTVRYTHGTSRSEMALPLGLAAAVFLIVDGYLLYRSSSDLHGSILRVDNALAESDVLRVQVGARQWAWDMRYPGQDNRFGTDDDIYLVSHLVVSQNRAVVFELASSDVVHSFYLPNFRIKQDAIPGKRVRGWFRPRKLGRFEIACAQHCGVHHYQMRGIVDVLPEDEFLEWQTVASADALRYHKEDLRALAEEPSRLPAATEPPRLDWNVVEHAPTHSWAWPWETSP